MCIDPYPGRPEDEREEEAWADPLNGECPGAGEAWQPEDTWPEELAGPEYWLYKNGLWLPPPKEGDDEEEGPHGRRDSSG